MESKLLINSKN